jgi:DUF4097 and DUF4098 domain-containing protein YvlB
LKIAAFVLFVVAGSLLASGCTVRVDTEERLAREEKRFQVTGAPEVRLSTFDGSVEVRSWDRPEVLVEVEKRAGEEDQLTSIEVRAKQDGNRIDVDVVRPSGRDTFVGFGIHISPQAKLIVSVPRRATIEARSGDGAIRADHLDGRVTLRTSDGSVRATSIKGELDVESRDGSITIDDADGIVRLSTGDGGITSSGRYDSLKVKSGDGSVTVRADRGSHLESDWSITTDDGSVAVYLPEQFAAELDAQTGDGTVRSDFDVQGGQPDERHRRVLRGRIGAGGNLLRIRTGDGSIRLRNW